MEKENIDFANRKIEEMIKSDINEYIKNKYEVVCDIDFNPKYQVYVVSPERGDWEALYINGKLLAEGHRLSTRDIFNSMADIFQNEFNSFEISDERAECGFPTDITDIPEYKFELMKSN